MSEYIRYSDIISHPELKHGKLYDVKLDSGVNVSAIFNVYLGGEEVAFLVPGTMKELSVAAFKVSKLELRGAE